MDINKSGTSCSMCWKRIAWLRLNIINFAHRVKTELWSVSGKHWWGRESDQSLAWKSISKSHKWSNDYLATNSKKTSPFIKAHLWNILHLVYCGAVPLMIIFFFSSYFTQMDYNSCSNNTVKSELHNWLWVWKLKSVPCERFYLSLATLEANSNKSSR